MTDAAPNENARRAPGEAFDDSASGTARGADDTAILVETLAAALACAGRGMPVIPLHYVLEDGRCSCGDPHDGVSRGGRTPLSKNSIGKHPYTELVPNGSVNATTDEARIRAWFTNRRCNLAVATGHPLPGGGQLGVVDVDPRDGGDESWSAACRKHSYTPNTAMQITGGGGEHHAYRVPEGMVLHWPKDSGPGVQVKNFNGYIVAEPSNHASGRTYRWEATSSPLDGTGELEDAPAWLLKPIPKVAPQAAPLAPVGDPEALAAAKGVIGRFNALHTAAGLLLTYGYRRNGDRFVSPSSKSGTPGVKVQDTGKVYSFHGSDDPLAAPCDEDGEKHAHDAFSVFRILGHGGDTKAAVKAAAAIVGDPPPDPEIVATVEALIQADRTRKAGAGSSIDGQAEGEPEPLRRELPPAAPFPVEALGPTLAGAVEAICSTVQCPQPVAAASVLMAGSLATQGLADVEIDGRIIPLSLYLLTIAESGERKSGSDRWALKPVDDHAKARRKDHAERVRDHEFDVKAHAQRMADAEREAVKGAAGNIAEALRRAGQAPKAPREPGRRVADATVEGLFRTLYADCQSQALASDEGGIVFSGHSMKAESKARAIGTLSKLWDGDPVDRIRSDGGKQTLYGRRLCAHLMIQPVIAETVLSDDLLTGQGILARMLVSWPESAVSTRPYVSRATVDDPRMVRYITRIGELLALPMPTDPEDPEDGLQPRALPLSDAAKRLWIDHHDHVEFGQAADGPYAEVRAWASKNAEQALRLAGVLTMVEDHEAVEVSAEVMRQACELARWFLAEAVRLVGTCRTPRRIRDAEALLKWIHDRHLTAVHAQQLQNKGPRAVGRDKAAMDAAIGALVEHGWLKPLPENTVIDGKPRRRAWSVWQRPRAGR